MILDSFTLISLFLTPATILLAFVVLRHWGVEAIKAIVSGSPSPQTWLIIGIAFGFMGSLVDNLYWGVAWHLSYIGSPYVTWWFDHGSISNVFFRQLTGILSGLCHVMSAYALSRGSEAIKMTRLMALCIALGAIYALFLVMGR